MRILIVGQHQQAGLMIQTLLGRADPVDAQIAAALDKGSTHAGWKEQHREICRFAVDRLHRADIAGGDHVKLIVGFIHQYDRLAMIVADPAEEMTRPTAGRIAFKNIDLGIILVV